jgi:archaellum biogenesis ATPase FlaH
MNICKIIANMKRVGKKSFILILTAKSVAMTQDTFFSAAQNATCILALAVSLITNNTPWLLLLPEQSISTAVH